MAIIPSGVSVPAQSKELDNTTTTTSYGTVYRQVVTLADPETATNYMRVGGNGAYVDVRNVVALPLPTGASTATLQTTGNASLSSVDTKLTTTNSTLATIDTDTGSISTSVSSIDTKTPALVTGRVPVDGSGVTQPVSAASLPLPSGASTSALQTTINDTLSALSAKFSALGQTTMAASVPVVLASNHSDIVTKKSASSYAHLNSTGTTTIKSGAGVLRRIVINTKGSTSNTLTIYDNTTGSGTVIGVIDTVNGASGHFEYGVNFSTGLTIVTANGTAADVTVIYE